MKILILGATGFIGSNLYKLFQKNNYLVKSMVRIDILSEEKLTKEINNVNVIINCIGSANVANSFKNTDDDFYSNVLVVRMILDILRKKNLTHIKFINLSSAAVYGNPSELPIKETHVKQPLSPYGYHKLISELLLEEYSRNFDLKTLSMRIFSAYGNGQKKLLLWDLHNKICNTDEKIILYGTGSESRDFIHIEDIFTQVLLIIKNSKFEGEALNISNGEEVTIMEIVSLFQKYYPMKFDFEFNQTLRLGDPLNWCADISIMKKWGYQQKITIDVGVKNYIKWVTNLDER